MVCHMEHSVAWCDRRVRANILFFERDYYFLCVQLKMESKVKINLRKKSHLHHKGSLTRCVLLVSTIGFISAILCIIPLPKMMKFLKLSQVNTKHQWIVGTMANTITEVQRNHWTTEKFVSIFENFEWFFNCRLVDWQQRTEKFPLSQNAM